MKRRASLLILLLAGAVSISCGKKGPLAPPFVRTPQTVQDLTLFQKGNEVILSWSNPTAYVDGNPLQEVSEVEVWMEEKAEPGARQAAKLTAEEFEDQAKLLIRLQKSRFPSLLETGTGSPKFAYAYPVEPEKIGGTMLVFGLKVRDEKRRVSEFSAPVSLKLRPSPSPPQDVRVAVLAQYIEVRWEIAAAAPGGAASPKAVGYNVYRSAGKEAPVRLNASPVMATEYRDQNFSFGTTYRYFVRAVAADAVPPIESLDSNVVEFLAKDSFPPAPPTGLTIISGTAFIALSWEANNEPDLAGYRIWRREAGQTDFVLLGSLPATESSYSDSAVEKNKRYDYAITALDDAGNESQKSEVVSGLIRGDRP
jgi:hypothetical protein